METHTHKIEVRPFRHIHTFKIIHYDFLVLFYWPFTHLTKICSKNVLLMFLLSHENVISECSLNIRFLNVLKTFHL